MPPRKGTQTDETEPNEKLLSNMRFYVQVKDTPETARKEISAGRLKGYTDINPMFRIQKLTEIFGPVGFGWWTQDEEFIFEECKTGETAVFCKLKLIVIDPDTQEVSRPITGVGGNKFVANEKNGPYCNDEAMKMAYTDALSIACKSLGFSHDIYYAKDRTKYTSAEDESNNEGPSPEDFKVVTSRIQKGITKVTADMDKEAKDRFTQDVVVKHIGGVNYMTCKDMGKLNALLEELLTMAKKTA